MPSRRPKPSIPCKLAIPATTERYFKVVNTGVNGFPTVAVTELRVFERSRDLTTESTRFDTVRLDASVDWRPNERVTSRFGFGYYTEWSGLGETKTNTPNERTLATPP